MDDILAMLNSDSGQELIKGVSSQLGMDTNSASGALSAAMPMILGAMKNNASTDEGSAQLMGALQNSKHSSGSMLDNLGSILGGSSIDQDVMDDGGKILGHVFGGQEGNAANALSKTSGIDTGSAMNLLKVAAPLIMSYLGKQTSQGSAGQGGLGDLLGGLLGGQGADMQSMASLIQGFDSNDSSIDDIAGMLGGSSGGSKGGIGGLLNDFLK